MWSMIAIVKNKLALSSKIVHAQLLNNSFLGLYAKEILKYVSQETGAKMFTETLLVRIKN